MIRYRATATLRRPQIHYSKTLPQKRAGGIQNQREHHIYSRTLKTPVTYRLYGEQNSV